MIELLKQALELGDLSTNFGLNTHGTIGKDLAVQFLLESRDEYETN